MRKIIILLSLVLSACSLQAPPYQVSMENVQAMKKASIEDLNVNKISSPKALDKISLRGSQMSSPVGNSYGEYLTKALEDELKLAKLWSGVSSTVISGEFLSNDIDVSGFSTGTGEASANFKVVRDDEIIFEKVISANIEFDSSFIGAVAIPNGQNNYVTLIQKIISNLINDNDFKKAFKS